GRRTLAAGEHRRQRLRGLGARGRRPGHPAHHRLGLRQRRGDADPRPARPVLHGDSAMSAGRVVIIGGGGVGAACAYYLARARGGGGGGGGGEGAEGAARREGVFLSAPATPRGGPARGGWGSR